MRRPRLDHDSKTSDDLYDLDKPVTDAMAAPDSPDRVRVPAMQATISSIGRWTSIVQGQPLERELRGFFATVRTSKSDFLSLLFFFIFFDFFFICRAAKRGGHAAITGSSLIRRKSSEARAGNWPRIQPIAQVISERTFAPIRGRPVRSSYSILNAVSTGDLAETPNETPSHGLSPAR